MKIANYILLVLLSLSLVLAIYFFKKSKHFFSTSKDLVNAVSRLELENQKLLNYETMSLHIENEHEKLLDLILVSEDGDTIPYKELGTDSLLMFFYSDLNCNSCIEDVLGKLATKSLTDNIHIISDYRSKRDLVNFKKRSNIRFEIFINYSKTYSNIYETFPFLVLKTKENKISFFPDKDYTDRTIKFLELWKN